MRAGVIVTTSSCSPHDLTRGPSPCREAFRVVARPFVLPGGHSYSRFKGLKAMASASDRAPASSDDAASPSVSSSSSLAQPLASSEKCIYLDYNATTPIAREVAEKMEPFLWEEFGNPSSSHFFGLPSAAAVRQARREIATMLGSERSLAEDEIVFVSCGTEGNNWAISGAAELARNCGGDHLPHVVTSSFEHPAVLECLKALSDQNRVSWTAVEPDEGGIVRPSAVVDALTEHTCLVTIMHSNNEVGTLQPIAEIVREVRAASAGPRRAISRVPLGRPIRFQSGL